MSCLGRRLRERPAHGEEQLGRLSDDLVRPVQGQPQRHRDGRGHDDPDGERRAQHRHEHAADRSGDRDPGGAPAGSAKRGSGGARM